MRGILGRKAGMSQLFADNGAAYPVTIIEVNPNVVLQVKEMAKDGYNSVKLGYGDKKDNKAVKAEIGIGKAANTTAKYFIREIRNFDGEVKQGDILDASIFETGQLVDVTGINKGKGFQGSIKRHGYATGPMGHGSKYHRGSGSMGDIRSTVKKSKKLPGHMGNVKTTVQNLVVVAIDLENNALVVKGSIPGPNKSYVMVRNAVKSLSLAPKTTIKLINTQTEQIKNGLLEQAKKVGAQITTSMSIEEMKSIISEATPKKVATPKPMMEEAKLAASKIEKSDNSISKIIKLEKEILEDATKVTEIIDELKIIKNINKDGKVGKSDNSISKIIKLEKEILEDAAKVTEIVDELKIIKNINKDGEDK